MSITTGQSIGAYEIVERLGTGGMGEVFRARDTRLGRFVAIKFVSPDFEADPASAERFLREAQLASSLNHPAIVTVYDIGTADGRPFIVMELIPGESLASRLGRARLPTNEAIEIAVQVADGLAAAHAANIVHRDLKPQNIMLTADGRPKIVDFGLSKLAASAAGPDDQTAQQRRLTAAHVVLGSAGYMSPEQIEGHPLDFRTDQFSFGAVVYEMLAGRRAFARRSSIETMAAIVADEPPAIAKICSDAPPAIVSVVERCLAKAPEHRYESTAQLASDLRAARDSADSARGRQGTLSWKLVAGIVTALIVVAAVVIGWPRIRGVSFGSSSAPREVVVLPFAAGTSDEGETLLAAGLADAVTAALYQLQGFDRSMRAVASGELVKEHIDNVKDARLVFGATQVLTGSVKRAEGHTRLTLTLVDASRDRPIGSQSVDIAGAVQSGSSATAVARATAALVGVTLDRTALERLNAGSTSHPEAFEAYVKGRGYLQRIDKAESVQHAIDLFTAAVTTDPEYALAHAALGEAVWRKFQLEHQPSLIDQAIDSCKTALRIEGRLAPVHVTLASIARSRGQYEAAIASATRALEVDPVSAEAYLELATAYEDSGRPADAEATYQKEIAARPDDWRAHNGLGAFYLRRNNAAAAEAPLKRVIDLTPNNTRGLNNLGATYFFLHRYEEAAAMWERSMAVRPNVGSASNLGTYYYERARYTEAARAFERAADLAANDYRVWGNLGAALYWAPGERPKAAAAYTRAVELAEQARVGNPKQPALLAQLADAYSMLGRVREARETADAVERLKPDDQNVLFRLAGVYEQIGDRATALTWLKRAIDAGYSRERIDRSPGLADLRKDARYLRFVK